MLNGINVQAILDEGLPWGNFEFGNGAFGPNAMPEDDRWREHEWQRNMLFFCNEYEGSYAEYLWWDENRNFGVLEDSLVYPWCPPLNEAGENLRDAISAGS